MTGPDRIPTSAPLWTETRIMSGRGNVGSGMFEQVLYIDVFDGAKGRAQVRMLHLPGRPSALSQVTSTGHEVALDEDRSMMLLLPQAGKVFCALGRRDLAARPGQAMVLPRGRRRTVTTRDGAGLFRALVLRLPKPGAGTPLANGAVLSLADLPDLSAAAALAAGLAGGTRPDAGLVAERFRATETLIAGGITGLLADPPVPRLGPGSTRALARAEALLREHATEEIAIRDVAERAGLSMRQMQQLFLRSFGMSPQAWLTRLRLEQAHLRLKGGRPAPTVTDTALSAGFTHLGRFPATYRARFGRLPSTERRRLA